VTDKDLHPSSNHPPIPPTPEDEQFARLRLLRSNRVGIVTFNRLLSEHGSAREALRALPQVAQAAGVSGYKACPEGVIHAELRSARAAGAKLLLRGEAPYPEILSELDDAPPFLWAIGNTALLTRPMISLVGARNASSLGMRMARSLAGDLGTAGMVVVSGLARGIDAAAHLAALDTGTIAIQAGGVDVMYPVENSDLAHQIAEQGLRLSEQPMGLQPTARHFPRRNRIISGLSRATIVIEAAARSGSLITARDALDQGREVMAVPGHPLDARSSGCNMLICDGAMLVRTARDVLEVIGTEGETHPQARAQSRGAAMPAATPAAKPRSLADLHKRILSLLGASPIAEDQLIRDLRAPAAEVAPALMDLELEGHVSRRPGGLLTRTI